MYGMQTSSQPHGILDKSDKDVRNDLDWCRTGERTFLMPIRYEAAEKGDQFCPAVFHWWRKCILIVQQILDSQVMIQNVGIGVAVSGP